MSETADTDPASVAPPVAGAPAPASTESPFDPPDDTLGSQIARTDAALAVWRDESVRRRAEFDERVARERETAAVRRTWMLRLALGSGALALFAGATGTALLAAVVAATPAPRPPPVVVAPPPVVVALPDVAPPVDDPVALPTGPVAAPSAAPGPEIRDAELWSNRTHAWVAFATPESGAIQIRWKDAAGTEVLEPMGCGASGQVGLRRCRAGRTHGRIGLALREGAAPGPWTVEACAGGGCAVVGTFPVGG